MVFTHESNPLGIEGKKVKFMKAIDVSILYTLGYSNTGNIILFEDEIRVTF